MRVLLTGASGFVGSRMLLEMPDQYEVRGFSRTKHSVEDYERFSVAAGLQRSRDLIETRVNDYVLGDFKNESDVARAVDGVEAIVHLGGIVHRGDCIRDKDESRIVNIGGTAFLLKYAKEQGIKKIVFASTDLVSGGSQCEYAKEKIECERLCKEYEKDVNDASVHILRFPKIFGPSPRMHVVDGRWIHVMPIFVEHVSLGESIVVISKGEKNTFIQIEDGIRVLRTAIDQKKPGLHVNNVWTIRISLHELATLVNEVGAERGYAPVEIKSIEKAMYPGVEGDLKFNFRPRKSDIKKGIDELFQFYEKSKRE